MWLIDVSSTVVTRHHGWPQPSSSYSASSISSPPPSPLYCRAIFRWGHRHRHRLRFPPTSTVFCLIVVCCRSLLLFVLVLSPFSSSRSLSALAPHSSAPVAVFLSSLLLLSRLFDYCVHPRRIWWTLFLLCWRITNVQPGHCRRRNHHHRRHGRRGSGVHFAGDGRYLHRHLRHCRIRSRAAASDGRPQKALTLTFSFSIAVVQIFSLLAASPTRPWRFASTVAPPPLLLVRKAPLLLVWKVYCYVGGADRVGRHQCCHLLLDRCRCHRFPTLPTEVCSLQRTPPRQLPVCSVLG